MGGDTFTLMIYSGNAIADQHGDLLTDQPVWYASIPADGTDLDVTIHRYGRLALYSQEVSLVWKWF